MVTHELKILPQYAEAITRGEKTFEVRKNDRGFQKGDHIKFLAYDDGWYLDHAINEKEYEITYVLSGFHIDNDYVIFSIKELKGGEADE